MTECHFIISTFDNILMFSLEYSTQQYAGKRLLFINYMINAGGMVWALSATGGHAQIYVMSEFSDDMLLDAIDKVKVISLNFPFFTRSPHFSSFITYLITSFISIVPDRLRYCY